MVASAEKAYRAVCTVVHSLHQLFNKRNPMVICGVEVFLHSCLFMGFCLLCELVVRNRGFYVSGWKWVVLACEMDLYEYMMRYFLLVVHNEF